MRLQQQPQQGDFSSYFLETRDEDSCQLLVLPDIRHSDGLAVCLGEGTGEHIRSEAEAVLKLTSQDGGSASKQYISEVGGTPEASCQAAFGLWDGA